MAAADHKLRVNGVYGLPISGALIMPVVVSGNRNTPAIMVWRDRQCVGVRGCSMTIEASFDEVVSKMCYSFCPLSNSAGAKPSTTAAIIHVSGVATSWEVI